MPFHAADHATGDWLSRGRACQGTAAYGCQRPVSAPWSNGTERLELLIADAPQRHDKVHIDRFYPGLALIVPSSSVSYCLWMSIAPPIFKRRIARQKRCVGKPVAYQSYLQSWRSDHSTMDKAPVRQRSTDPKAGKISAREDRLHDQTLGFARF